MKKKEIKQKIKLHKKQLKKYKNKLTDAEDKEKRIGFIHYD